MPTTLHTTESRFSESCSKNPQTPSEQSIVMDNDDDDDEQVEKRADPSRRSEQSIVLDNDDDDDEQVEKRAHSSTNAEKDSDRPVPLVTTAEISQNLPDNVTRNAPLITTSKSALPKRGDRISFTLFEPTLDYENRYVATILGRGGKANGKHNS